MEPKMANTSKAGSGTRKHEGRNTGTQEHKSANQIRNFGKRIGSEGWAWGSISQSDSPCPHQF